MPHISKASIYVLLFIMFLFEHCKTQRIINPVACNKIGERKEMTESCDIVIEHGLLNIF